MARSNPPTDALIAALAPYALGAVVLWFLYKRGQSTLPAKIEEVKQASKDIVRGLPSAVGSLLRGENASGYVSPEQFAAEKARIDEALRLKKAQNAVGLSGFPNFMYGK